MIQAGQGSRPHNGFNGVVFDEDVYIAAAASALQCAPRSGLRKPDTWMPRLSEKKINLVHFRAVQGTVPNYTEVFIDEGDIDMMLAMKTYKEAGYSGPIVSDHTPAVVGDNGWGLLGRTYSHGFMNAAVHAANLF